MPICVPATSLAIQLPTNSLGKEVKDGPNVCSTATHIEDPDEAPGLGVAHFGHLGSESAAGSMVRGVGRGYVPFTVTLIFKITL